MMNLATESELYALFTRLLDETEKMVIGKRSAAELVMVALLAGGHVLLEDVPGVGKTRLVRVFSRLWDLTYARIQGTPDLLPGDIVGTLVYEPQTHTTRFNPGPIFHHLILVDEINRATPRTQSALLEAMEEQSVTVDGVSYPLPDPFMVLATENPIEMEGTFPLPEAQLDRFLLSLELGYPSLAEERNIVERFTAGADISRLSPLGTATAIHQARQHVQNVQLSGAVAEYLVELCRATREAQTIRLGASPRATVQLARAAKALAFLRRRTYVIPDDIQAPFRPVIAHRILLDAEADLRNISSRQVLTDIIDRVTVPVEEYE